MTTVLSQREVAEELRVSPRTVQRWSREGYFIKPSYIGQRAVYEKRAVEAWISSRFS